MTSFTFTLYWNKRTQTFPNVRDAIHQAIETSKSYFGVVRVIDDATHEVVGTATNGKFKLSRKFSR